MGRICAKKKNTGGDTMKQTLKDPLKHFIPKWTFGIIQSIKEFGNGKRDKKNNFIYEQSGYKMDYADGSKCLVGESQLFRTSYEPEDDNSMDRSCRTCSNLAQQPAHAAMDSKVKLFNFKTRLYKHIEDKHSDLYATWEKKRNREIKEPW